MRRGRSEVVEIAQVFAPEQTLVNHPPALSALSSAEGLKIPSLVEGLKILILLSGTKDSGSEVSEECNLDRKSVV